MAAPVGRTKAAPLERAGFKTVNEWEAGKPEFYRAAAQRDPAYLASRNELRSQILSTLAGTPATPQHKAAYDSYYTKHTVADGIEHSSEAAVVKAAWDFEKDGQRAVSGRMVTLIPSRYPTDDEEAEHEDRKDSK